MKIIHCADLHLDSNMESNLSREQAMLRREELLETYEAMVAYGAANQVRVILIAGDLFDKPHIRKTAKQRVLEQMYLHPEMDFCYLRGNHDQCDFLSDLSDDELPENLRQFSEDQWTSYVYGDVVISGLELNRQNSRTLGMDLVLDQTKCNIVMLHGQEADYESKDPAEVVQLSALRGKYIDYLALGHIHSYKKERLDDRGVYCYSGCLEGRGFDECGQKGFVLLNVEDGRVESTFVPLAKRQFHEVTVEITPEMDMPRILEEVRRGTDGIPKEDLVKVVLTGKIRMDFELDKNRVIRALQERFFFGKAYDRTGVEIDYESFRYDMSLKGEFVRLMEQQDFPEEERAQMIELGIKAIMGGDLEA